MDVHRLRYFLSVMEHKNFARAADSLNVSQPAVTHAVSKLEKELDVRLFDRGRFGAVPTEFALTLERRARLIMAEMEMAKGDLAAMTGAKKGRLSVGVGVSFVPRLLPHTLADFIKRWPEVVLNLVDGNAAHLSPKLLNGEVDVMLAAPPRHYKFNEEIQSIPLFTELDQLTVRADHPLVGTYPVTLEHLREYPWFVARNLGLWQRFRQIFQDAEVTPPEISAEMTSASLAINSLICSDGIALMGDEICAEHINSGALTTLDVPVFTAERQAYFCFRRRSPLKLSAKNFLSVLKKHCRTMNEATLHIDPQSSINNA